MKSHPHRENSGPGLLGAKGRKLSPFALALGLSLVWEPVAVRAQTLPSITSGALLVRLQAEAGVTTDATGTNVTSWTDQAANGFTFGAYLPASTNGYPSLITNGLGRPLIHFATNSVLGTPGNPVFVQLFATPNSGLTIFAAFSTANHNVQQYLVDHAVPTSGSLSLSLELGPDAGARGAGTYGLNRSGGSAVNANNNTTYAPINTLASNVFCVMSTVIKSNGYAPSNVDIYKNGVAQPLSVVNGGGLPTTPGWLGAGQYDTDQGALFIGGRVNVANASLPADAYFRGDVGELLIYQGSLSLQDRAAVEAYLGSKYTVTIVPPANLLITAQPQNLAVTNGEPATFVVAAEALNGDPITYQWRTNGVSITDATNATFTIPAAGAADVASYQCVVSIPATNITTRAAQLRLLSASLPAVTSGTLLVHLRADAGVVTSGSDVTSWLDQSANGFEFDANFNPATKIFYPTTAVGANGNKVVHFDGASVMSNSVSATLFTDTNAPLTVFAAFSIHERSVQRYLFNLAVPRNTSVGYNELMIGVDAGNRGVGNYGVHRAGGAATFTRPNLITNDQFYVMSMVIKSNGIAPDNILVNQNSVPRPVTGLPATSANNLPETGWLSAGHYPVGSYTFYVGVAADSGQLAAGNFSAVGPFAGDIGEIIIYQGQLSDSDRAQVENYLGGKYGLAPTLGFLAQPQPLALASGAAATFAVVAAAASGETDLTYQWQKNGVNIDTATNATLTLPAITPSDAAYYRVVVSIPGTNITSDAALLRVIPSSALPVVSSGSLLLHLRADSGLATDAGGFLTTWTDQSPNGYVFNAISNPTNSPPAPAVGLTGNRVIHFNGANNNLLCSSPVEFFPTTSSPLTMFTVSSLSDNSIQRYSVNLRVPRIGTSAALIAANFSACSGYSPSLTSWFNELSLGVTAGNRDMGNYGVHRAAGDSTFTQTNTFTFSNNQFYELAMVIKSTGNAPTNIAIYQNGVALPVTGYLEANAARGPRDQGWLSPGDYPTGSSNSGGNYELRIGATRDAPLTIGTNAVGNCWWGDIGEVIIYQGALSDADRMAVETYLGAKYGVGLPSLQISVSGGNVVISYPAKLASYVLENTLSLTPPITWAPATPAPVLTGNQFSATYAASGQMYYRLRQVP